MTSPGRSLKRNAAFTRSGSSRFAAGVSTRSTTAVGRTPDATRDCRWFASMTFATRSRVDCERQAFPPKIAKHSLAMPIIRWPVIMRVPMWVAYSNRRICFSTGAVHGPCYASPTPSEDVWLRVPTGSHSKRGVPGFAGQVLEFNLGRTDRWITGPTTVPQQQGGLGFRCQVLEKWRARQDLNPRPPGS
jgi:hypothetical protein